MGKSKRRHNKFNPCKPGTQQGFRSKASRAFRRLGRVALAVGRAFNLEGSLEDLKGVLTKAHGRLFGNEWNSPRDGGAWFNPKDPKQRKYYRK